MKTMSRKLWIISTPMIGALLLFAATASAHVTIAPAQSAAGAWETYTLKVPSEKDSPTVELDLRIPEGAQFKQYEPVYGWDVTADGNKVTWKATGGGIQPGQFQRFTFTVKNPVSPGNIAWNAYQHYGDGSLVQWSGEEGSETPHAVTSITEASGSEGGHDHSGMSADHSSMSDHAAMGEARSSASVSPLVYAAFVLSLLALALSLISLIRRRRV
ncbi:uncharacterized protein YcnI [Paenibacillus forsythiae]|uniref:Uncharacterized protein YcnI n=1 Tax=Paenibacillus forsythiae TaxID=365616 RepID=A0ABU3H6Q0_9BACL|nr:DUF1775 domain-containing protein [Paenibacillus forsythiae]MDT3425732.1 uncharacterized protein YcnI [Paenibacillus forsythiae]